MTKSWKVVKLFFMKPPSQLDASWILALKEEWGKSYMDDLARFLAAERAGDVEIYPPKMDVFSAFNFTPFDKVQVVIMGQDPYHGPGQAHGLSFSVGHGIRQPPSLKNIFKELEVDLGVKPPEHGNLEGWARQGVLMLNATLTVRARSPRSHYGQGWERFTDAVVANLSERKDPVIFVLWGKSAHEKCAHVAPHHHVLKSPHPSPYSAHSGFFGSRHFSKINELLTKQDKEPINWAL